MKNILKDKTAQTTSTSVIFIGVIIAILVCVVSIWGLHEIDKKTNSGIQTEVFEQSEIPTLAEGQSPYTFKDKEGREYIVNQEGTFLKSENGLVKVEKYINIDPFKTYSFAYTNGTTTSFTVNKDGTYDMLDKYTDGKSTVSSGKAVIRNGSEDCIKAAKVKDLNELLDSFKISPASFNPNNLYHITLYYGESTPYEEKGKEIVYSGNSEPDDGGDTEDFVLQEFVIYLENEDTVKKDKDGKEYYDVRCIAYSTMYNLLYAEWSVNNTMNVENFHYIEEAK